VNHRLDMQSAGLRELAARRAQKATRRVAGAPVVAVTGAKGGVGKTVLAVNLALLLARKGLRTLLVDLDPGCGNVDVHLRCAPTHTLDDVLEGRCDAERALCEGPSGLRILTGRSGSPTLTDMDQARLALGIVGQLAQLFDVVICDTGAGIGPAVIETAQRATLVLGATTPDPSAVTDAYALCKVLHQRGLPVPRLVVNRARNRQDAMLTATRLRTVCRRFLAADCELLGFVTDDPRIEASCREQRPLACSGDPATGHELEALANALLASIPAMPQRSPRRQHLVEVPQTAGPAAAG
jgi:flagellar biosynthesis protein FlhG